MSACLDFVGCPRQLVEYWKELNVTKHILFLIGAVMAVTGFYYGCQMEQSDEASRLNALVLCFIGMLGISLMMYIVAWIFISEYRRLSSIDDIPQLTGIAMRVNGGAAYSVRCVNRPPAPAYPIGTNFVAVNCPSKAFNVTIHRAGTDVRLVNLQKPPPSK